MANGEWRPVSERPQYSAFHRKTNWLAALVCECLAPLLRAYAHRRCGKTVSDPRSWEKALLLGDNHIGDILYRTCSLDALKRGLPQCDFYYLTDPNTAVLLEGNPAIRSVLPWARSDSTRDLLPCHLTELKAFRFDAVLSTNPIRYWPELALAVSLGAPNRAGYTHKGFSGWVTHPMPIRYPQPFPAYFRDYVAALTGQAPVWPLRPRLYPRASDQEAARVAWEKLEPDSRRPVLACFMTTRQPLGALPMELIGPILQEIKRQANAQLLLMGTTADASLLEQVNRRYGLDAQVLAGTLGLGALSAFLGHCDAVLTTDSGPRHLANAAGVPVFFFRNLWSSCVETGCYTVTETDLCPRGLERLSDAEQRRVLSGISPGVPAGQVVQKLRRQDATGD